jgi:hypothetical protein
MRLVGTASSIGTSSGHIDADVSHCRHTRCSAGGEVEHKWGVPTQHLLREVHALVRQTLVRGANRSDEQRAGKCKWMVSEGWVSNAAVKCTRS